MIIDNKVVFGNIELKIFKRKAIDVIELAEFARKQQGDTAQIFQMAKIVSDSLKHNLKHLKWWKIFSYFFMRKLTSVKGLLKYFSIDEINEIALKVLESEGVDISSKKKVETNP